MPSRAPRAGALAALGVVATLLVVLAWMPLVEYGRDVRAVELDRHRASHTRACEGRDECTLLVGVGDLALQLLVTLGAALVLAGLLTDGVGMRAGGLLLLAAWVPPALVGAMGAVDARDVRETLVHAFPQLFLFGAVGGAALLARRRMPLSSRAA